MRTPEEWEEIEDALFFTYPVLKFGIRQRSASYTDDFSLALEAVYNKGWEDAGGTPRSKKMQTHIVIDGIETKQFIATLAYDKEANMPFSFAAAMISCCDPLFNGCESNYAVEALLRKSDVLDGVETDTEYSCFYAYFSTKEDGVKFVERLNEYLRARATALAVIKEQGFFV